MKITSNFTDSYDWVVTDFSDNSYKDTIYYRKVDSHLINSRSLYIYNIEALLQRVDKTTYNNYIVKVNDISESLHHNIFKNKHADKFFNTIREKFIKKLLEDNNIHFHCLRDKTTNILNDIRYCLIYTVIGCITKLTLDVIKKETDIKTGIHLGYSLLGRYDVTDSLIEQDNLTLYNICKKYMVSTQSPIFSLILGNTKLYRFNSFKNVSFTDVTGFPNVPLNVVLEPKDIEDYELNLQYYQEVEMQLNRFKDYKIDSIKIDDVVKLEQQGFDKITSFRKCKS